MCQINLSSLYDRMGQREKSQTALADALAIARSLVNEYPNLAPAKHLLARCLGAQARTPLEQGNLAAAAAAYEDEIRVREELVQARPQQQTYQTELAEAYRNLAVVEQRYEHLDAARKLLDKALAIDRRLAREHPDDGFLQHVLARTLTHSGDLARTGRPQRRRPKSLPRSGRPPHRPRPATSRRPRISCRARHDGRQLRRFLLGPGRSRRRPNVLPACPGASRAAGGRLSETAGIPGLLRDGAGERRHAQCVTQSRGPGRAVFDARLPNPDQTFA